MSSETRERRRKRIRARINGTADRPRVSVYRSLRHIAVQFINDEAGRTLLAVSSIGMKSSQRHSKTEVSRLVGKEAAAQAKIIGIGRIVFDRGGFKYHGRVKAVAEALRAGGLTF